jgi:hypothetical protein
MISQAAIHFGVAYYVTSLCVKIPAIIFIILPVVNIVCKKVSLGMRPKVGFVPVIVLFSVTGLLYFVFVLLFVVTYAIGDPINQIFMCASLILQVRISFLGCTFD